MGDISSKMEATIAAIRVELKSEMAALRVELKTDMAMLFMGMGKMHAELMANHWELKSDIVDIKSKMGNISTQVGKAEDGIKSLGWQVKALYGAALAVYIMYICTPY